MELPNYYLNVNEKINKKGSVTIDLKKEKEPTSLNLLSGQEGQIIIDRKKNDITITLKALKSSKTSDYRIFYKNESWIDGSGTNASSEYFAEWGELYYDEYGTKDWIWLHYSQGENGMVNVTGEEISDDEVQPQDKLTFYVLNKNNLNNIIYEKYYTYKNTLANNENADNEIIEQQRTYLRDNYTKGGTVIDYSRNLGKIYIKNANYYNGSNPVYMTSAFVTNYDLINATYNFTNTANKKTMTGSNFNENIMGSDSIADKIYTGGGTDTIDAGKGNDKIYINGKGEKTISISQGDGNDTIYNAYKATTVTLNLDDYDYDDLFYTKKGNNLVISRGYSLTDIEATALTNFFNKKPKNVYISGDTTDIMTHIDNTDIRLLISSESKSIKGTGYSEQIYGGEKTKSISAVNGDNWIITDADNKYAMSLSAGNGDDVYYLNNIDKKITISDSGSDSDMIIITDDDHYTDLFQFYDIKLGKNGKYTIETSLHILSTDNNTGESIKSRKGKLSENIVIKNAMKKDGSGGKGWIEQIGVSNNQGTVSFTPEYGNLEQAVVGWLSGDNSTGKHYQSAMTALKKASADEINELIQLYANYTSPS